MWRGRGAIRGIGLMRGGRGIGGGLTFKDLKDVADVSVYVPDTSCAYEVYWNGRLIGRTDAMPAPTMINQSGAKVFRLGEAGARGAGVSGVDVRRWIRRRREMQIGLDGGAADWEHGGDRQSGGERTVRRW